VTFSPGDIDVGIRATLIQIYPILLSTLLSINTPTLSLFDAAFALLLTSSPLTIYLVVASVCGLFGFETNLYKRIKSYRCTIRILGALIPLLWLGLSLTLTFSDKAFMGSQYCRNSSFKDWLLITFWSLVFDSPFQPGYFGVGYGILPAVALAFSLCLFRRRSQVMKDLRADREGKPKLWGRLRIPWTFVKCAWCVSVVVVSD
jgi:hypothetical protein